MVARPFDFCGIAICHESVEQQFIYIKFIWSCCSLCQYFTIYFFIFIFFFFWKGFCFTCLCLCFESSYLIQIWSGMTVEVVFSCCSWSSHLALVRMHISRGHNSQFSFCLHRVMDIKWWRSKAWIGKVVLWGFQKCSNKYYINFVTERNMSKAAFDDEYTVAKLTSPFFGMEVLLGGQIIYAILQTLGEIVWENISGLLKLFLLFITFAMSFVSCGWNFRQSTSKWCLKLWSYNEKTVIN